MPIWPKILLADCKFTPKQTQIKHKTKSQGAPLNKRPHKAAKLQDNIESTRPRIFGSFIAKTFTWLAKY
jgi:hypothetical protein